VAARLATYALTALMVTQLRSPDRRER
jgi:hypothetical protein